MVIGSHHDAEGKQSQLTRVCWVFCSSEAYAPFVSSDGPYEQKHGPFESMRPDKVAVWGLQLHACTHAMQQDILKQNGYCHALPQSPGLLRMHGNPAHASCRHAV